MTKLQNAEKLVDLILDGKYDEIKKSGKMVDSYLEAVENEIPEEPEDEKIAGKKVKKEIESEHVDNAMPEVPDTGKTPGKDIKKAITDPSTSVAKPKDPIKNDIPTVPEETPTAASKLKKVFSMK